MGETPFVIGSKKLLKKLFLKNFDKKTEVEYRPHQRASIFTVHKRVSIRFKCMYGKRL